MSAATTTAGNGARPSKTLRGRRNGRPPWDPSAAYRPKNALEKQAMQSHAFRQKVQTANGATICNTTSDKVGRLPLKDLLTSDKFCVPIFQRRYCWTPLQWQTLLDDIQATLESQHQHSLGRLTCTNNIGKTNPKSNITNTNNTLTGVQMIPEGRSCILDGQQRFTTVTILLAAIRDLLPENDNDNLKLIHSINSLIFTDVIQLRAWCHKPDSQLQEGMELDFSRLVPTYCDRYSYYTAVLPKSDKTQAALVELESASSSITNNSWHRPLQAKNYFLSQLQSASTQRLQSIVHALLNNCNMLYFPVDIHQGHQDGTEDLMVIYERLAIRDATYCAPNRVGEFQTMDGADMIRNLLLGSMDTPANALDFYKTYWLPLEQQKQQRQDDDDASNDTNETSSSIGNLIQSFLEQQSRRKDGKNDDDDAKKTDGAAEDEEETPSSNVKKGIIGGQIYADFQAWFAARLHESKSSTNQDQDGRDANQNHLVRTVGEELLQFSQESHGA
ncbi:Protein of unknown function (DUF1524) [Seminavis robusta]|uniref:GmrSD restriction endonucleases N-terminal domain-containing protein n=1 Tax=Seminavis robusta TaxID=568900 RepID=A0A9N8GZE7_9STRA|nr:Protein of unknown function (DUF1524) [Seminavis robusta]|eukprot:Sro3_g002280.1 Protein of unknown function (DUF1524) (502) ;mRNA; f:106619-108124